MKNLIKLSALVALSAGIVSAAEYKIDAFHSNVCFVAKHLTISKVNGNFKSYDAVVDYDKATNELKTLTADIDVTSINTQNEKRDKHLVGDDFFDAAKFPKIKFQMTKFKKDGANEGKIYGDLTIKNITKPVVLDFEYNGESKNAEGKEVIGISLDGEITRADFDIATNYPDLTISNKIILKIEIEAKAK